MEIGRWRDCEAARNEGERKKEFVLWQVSNNCGCSGFIAPPTPSDALDLIEESNWVGDIKTDGGEAV